MSKWENCFNIFSHMLPTFRPIIEPPQLGLSTGAHTRPTRGKLSNSYPKPADPTLVTVGNGFQIPETKTSRSVDESAFQNPIPTNPTVYILETPTDFLKYEDYQSFLGRSVEIRWDLFENSSRSLQDLVSTFRNLARSGHVSTRSSRFRPVSAKFCLVSSSLSPTDHRPIRTQYPSRPN